jgi:hypothetical protein
VLAVGRALAVPLTDEERRSPLPYLQWPRKVGKLAKQLDNWKSSSSPTARVCCQSMREQLEAVFVLR